MGSPTTVLIGLGNPYHGDDAIGLIIARQLYLRMQDRERTDLLELSACSFGVMEGLLGYNKAVIIDALLDDESGVGTVKSIAISQLSSQPGLSFHTAGFQGALAMAKFLGLPVPGEIAIYGIVILDPWSFSPTLSKELEASIPRILERFCAVLREP